MSLIHLFITLFYQFFSMLSFPGPLILEDERALLRPLEESDLAWLLPYALTEPETWVWSMTSPASEKGMEQYIRETLLQKREKKEYPFIVFDKLKNRYAGSTRFYDIQLFQRSAQLGYTWYGKEFRRTGLNRHCKWLMLNYAFEEWGLERVEFRADARNQASIEAMKAIGCTVEGVLRSHAVTSAGGRRDSIVLSILRAEWFDRVKEQIRGIILPTPPAPSGP